MKRRRGRERGLFTLASWRQCREMETRPRREAGRLGVRSALVVRGVHGMAWRGVDTYRRNWQHALSRGHAMNSPTNRRNKGEVGAFMGRIEGSIHRSLGGGRAKATLASSSRYDMPRAQAMRDSQQAGVTTNVLLVRTIRLIPATIGDRS